jgi:hypothetical protein
MPRTVVLVVVPLGLGLAGCGGGSKVAVDHTVPTATSAGGSNVVSQAVAKTGKSSYHIVFSGAANASSGSATLGGSGDLDPSARRGPTHVHVALGGAQVPLDEILDGTNAYISSTFLSSFLPSGKKWLKVDLASAAKTFGPAAFALTSPGTVPALLDVREVGTATVDGVQTIEYTGRIDLSKLPASARSSLEKAHVTASPVHVWVGSDGYVHRTRLEMSSSSSGTRNRLELTTTLSEFGEKVSVTPPPAAETIDASKTQIPGFGGLGA